MTRVIAAIENSLAARPVLVTAAAVADVLGGSVEALHIADDGGHTAQASAEQAGVALRQLPGDPVERIIEQASAADVVAVVLGARERASGRRTGHIPRAVADGVDRPVIVVPPGIDPSARIHRVVIAMEGTAAKARSLKSAVEVAAGADLELIVVHVDDEESIPSFSDQAAHETDAYASEFLARYLHGVEKVRLELRVGVPADEILGVGETADLIAVGWPQHATGDRGAVAREVLDRSRVPVLLVALGEGA
jgi:nucleotide-binding universal stress UspA family protein